VAKNTTDNKANAFVFVSLVFHLQDSKRRCAGNY
jgi:hypothetical protein